MPKEIREQIGYCQRSGFKVPARTLVPDGETGKMVEEGWEDREHPQKYQLPQVPDEKLINPEGVAVNIESFETVDIDPLMLAFAEDEETLNQG